MSFLPTIVALCTISTVLSAQPNPNKPKTWLGGQIGIDVGILHYDPKLRTENELRHRTGISGSMAVDYWLSPEVALGVELLYVQKGMDSLDYEKTSSILLSYLALPVLIKISLPANKIKPYLIIGPELGANLTSSQSRSYKSGGIIRDDISDEEIAVINASIIMGAGISLFLSWNSMLDLNALYDYGLTNLNITERGEMQKIFTRDIRISVGVKFALRSHSDVSPLDIR